MSGFFGVIDDVNVQCDGPDGTYLFVLTEDGKQLSFQVADVEALVAAVEPLRRHLRDRDAVRRERASWAGYDLSGATDGEWLRYAADLTRKAWRERGAA